MGICVGEIDSQQKSQVSNDVTEHCEEDGQFPAVNVTPGTEEEDVNHGECIVNDLTVDVDTSYDILNVGIFASA